MKAIYLTLGLVHGILIGGMLLPAKAQVISDGTTNTTVNLKGNNYSILNGIEKGKNLFHSFSNFSVPTGSAATFDLSNTPNITTIFSRVTGGNVSQIDGLIRTANSSNPVSLFLMNPAGIVFGKNAALNISGSFVATTANSIKFSDGVEFSAVNSGTPPLLTISAPIGLQLGSSAGQIQVQGSGNDAIVPTKNLGIVASPGQTIGLVGGDIQFTGGVITAPAGRIEIGAVGNGTVNLVQTPAGWQFDYSQVQDFRSVNFTQRSSLWNPYLVGNPLGGIQVVGGDIRLEQSQIAAATVGNGQGGSITVNAAGSLFLGGVNPKAQAPSAWIVNQVAQRAMGNGGGVNIKARQLTLQDGAAIETLTLGAGAAGNVQVTADTIAARGAVALKSALAPSGTSMSRIASETYASGAGGDVTIVARKLTLEDGGQVGATVFPGATGRGGNISVDVTDKIDASGVSPIGLTPSGINAFTLGIGNGGNVRVSTGTLNVTEGASIISFASRLAGIPGTGIGNAGDVTVVAREGINMVGISPILPTQMSYVGSSTTGSGNSGNVSVTTPILSLQDGANLATTTVPVIGIFGDPNQSNNVGNSGNVTVNVADRLTVSGINRVTLSNTFVGSGTYSNGNAGNVTVHTNQLLVKDGGGVFSATSASGNAGALTIHANEILIEGQNLLRPAVIGVSARIFTETTRRFYHLPDVPTGNTGVLNINTQKLTIRNGGYIVAVNDGIGNAGQLNIQADNISLDRGQINTTTASGNGGNINLALGNILVSRHGSKITASAGGSGNGGNITIDSPIVLGLENSDIIANAFQGRGGNINITTQGLFGLKYSDHLTNDSDITASSQFGVNGTVDIHNFGVDPNSGLVELPANVTDSSQKIATGCSNHSSSSFVVTGRGGIPDNPNQQLMSDRTWSDVRNLSVSGKPNEVNTQIPTSPADLIQATSWRRNQQGKIELIADDKNAQAQHSLNCGVLSQN
ncbi:S-layer family protein [Aetokthonos hydrillicola Thurmond2011]|jgi:filamentous hemagglutinin family protein|uniref:S-layer family protein n=1 Tax=Aetokthonos hydrillicola Thurmond2011 TaxID=2712845 RepID=A0AAP5IEH1_9CYAN|nr:S-layer family protein [Aetokthonos hydrillicola]MBO3457226.1 S-layer family protein [Aetokthonos hydrillicola CCALA 1050]MBW4587576.1 S-layer family protein [Aetokthonos hydrillicola CCALA 1050]MDR9900158.1 S-layer family protein [Aetokthonos hydrillicola Thurmond2011]